jgi:hypothetical protein
VDIERCNALMVKADIKNVEAEERTKNVKKLAGAITHSLEDNKEVVEKYEIQSLTDKSLFPENMQGDDFASKLCRIRADEAWEKNPACKSNNVTPVQKLVRSKIIAEAVNIGEEVRKLEGLSDFISAHGSIKNLKELTLYGNGYYNITRQ